VTDGVLELGVERVDLLMMNARAPRPTRCAARPG